MSNSNGEEVLVDHQARFAQLDERVSNLRSSVSHLETQMQTGFANINHSLSGLNDQLRHGQRTQWPVIWSAAGVTFAILAGVAALLINPMKEDIAKLEGLSVSRSEYETNLTRGSENRNRLENAISKIAESTVPRSEIEFLVAESRSDRQRLNNELASMEEHVVSRVEWVERNRARDQEIIDMSRRINELQQAIGATYNLRDVIIDLKEQVRTLEMSRLQSRSALP